MRYLLALLSLIAAVPAQIAYIANQVGQQSPGSTNGCWTTASMHCSVAQTITLPGCANSMGVFRLGSIAQVAGTAGFLWPAPTEGPILFAIEIAPSATCYYPLPSAVTVPASDPACSNLWMANATVFVSQWTVAITGPGFPINFSWIDIPIPNNTSLVGHWIVSQTLHLSPLSGLWQLSPRHEGVINF